MYIDFLKKQEIGITGAAILGKKIFKENIRPIFIISLVLFLPVNIIGAFVFQGMNAIISSFDIVTVTKNIEMSGISAMPAEFQDLWLYYLVFSLIQLFVLPLGEMAVAKLTFEKIYEREISASQAILFSISKGAVLIIATVFYMILSTMGFFLMVIPGFIIMIYFCFYIYTITLSGKGPLACLTYSAALVKKRFMKTLGGCVALFLMQYAVSWMIVSIFSLFGTQPLVIAIQDTVASFVNTVFCCTWTAWYMSREFVVQKEISSDNPR